MSSNGSPLHATEIGVKRNRKATEPQRLSSFFLSSPEEVMNPSSANSLTGDSQGVNDQTINIFNLAGAIAMNSLLSINQPPTIGGFLNGDQLNVQDPLLTNAAKMVLNMNFINAAANHAESSSASNSTAELMSLITSRPDAAAQSISNLQQAVLFQKYAALSRGQIPNVSHQLAALQMSLARTAENGSGQQNDRKRSFPSTEFTSQVEELRKRVYSDSRAINVQRMSGEVSIPHVPVSKDDMERCLDRILNEEIYNIYEDDVKSVEKADTVKNMSVEEIKKQPRRSSGSPCSLIEQELSIDEILSIIASASTDKKESGIASVGSAFRKVSSRSHTSDSISGEVAPDTLLWATSESPSSISPQDSEVEFMPLSQELINQLHDLAISHREADPDIMSNGLILTREDQLKRFPVVWQGTLAMKQSETTVQMHLVYGSVEMLTRCLGDANADAKNAVPIRVNQRMRLEHAQVQGMVAKMSDAGRFACMICLPCGLSRDEIITNSDIFRTAFIDYFSSKQAAGIAVMPQTETTTGCLVHVFPPGDFPSSYLQYYSPQLYESITTRQASFLFVVLTPDESSRPLTS